MQTLYGLLIVLILWGLPVVGQASDVSQPQSTLYSYKNSIELQEEFSCGTAVSGSAGCLAWLTSGTITFPTSATGHPGLYNLDSTAVSGTWSGIRLGSLSTIFDVALPTKVLWVVRLNTNDANTTTRIGAFSTVGSAPADGIYFQKLDASTTWRCVTRAASSETVVDSSVTITTGWVTLAFNRNSDGVTFTIDGVAVCGTMTATIPTVFVTPAAQIVNSAAASKTLDADYMKLQISGLTR